MKMMSRVLYLLVALVIGFSDVALSQEDPCAAYVSQSGIARCQDRVLKIERMKQAKENRQERNKSVKERMKSRGSGSSEAVAAVESSENTETASAVAADSMTDEEMRKEVLELREKLKLLGVKDDAVTENPVLEGDSAKTEKPALEESSIKTEEALPEESIKAKNIVPKVNPIMGEPVPNNPDEVMGEY